MLLLVVAIAVFAAWSWLSYPAVGYWLYDLSVATEGQTVQVAQDRRAHFRNDRLDLARRPL